MTPEKELAKLRIERDVAVNEACKVVIKQLNDSKNHLEASHADYAKRQSETDAGKLLTEMGMCYYDTESCGRRVAEFAAPRIRILTEQLVASRALLAQHIDANDRSTNSYCMEINNLRALLQRAVKILAHRTGRPLDSLDARQKLIDEIDAHLEKY